MKQERKAQFEVGAAFYNHHSQTARDLGVLAASVYRQQHGSLRVLDAMSGCGVRSLRYWLESEADWVWSNEANPELYSILRQNLYPLIDAKRGEITCNDANRLLFDCYQKRNYYDLVDIDCFGAAVPYINTGLWAVKIGGLIYLTSTDGRRLTGHLSEGSLQAYGTYARTHPAAQEQALRIIVGSIQQQAAMRGMGVEPIFGFFCGQTYRIMIRLVPSVRLSSENYGFLGYCHRCGEYLTIPWRKLGGATCSYDSSPLTISGPMWLGKLYNCEWLKRMQQQAKRWQWQQSQALLEQMQGETDFPPYFYTLGEIGRRGKMDIPARSHLISALEAASYRAATTHINPQAIKTDADLHTCVAIARTLIK